MPCEDLDRRINSAEKVFDRVGHGILVGGSSNLEFLPEFLHLKEHCFGFIGHISIKVWNGLNTFVDGVFERISWLNWCVSRKWGWSVTGIIRRVNKSGRWV